MTKIQSQSEDYFWSVQRKIHIDSSKTEVWKIISSERNLEKFHPFCKTNEVISWDGTNFIDRIEYHNGRKLERNFTEWFEGEGYDLVIGDAGVQGFGLRASGGKRAWASESEGGDDVGLGGNSEAMNADGANKLYVGLLIMLIFSEALALYGLIVALILSQHSYVCE